MGKPRKLCHNPLHDEWSTVEKRNVEKVRVLQYKHLVLIKKLGKERGFASHRIRSVCFECQNAIEKHEETQSSEQCVSSAGHVGGCPRPGQWPGQAGATGRGISRTFQFILPTPASPGHLQVHL